MSTNRSEEELRKREQRGRDVWAEIVRLQEESGLSGRAFCVREMINTTSFYRWRGRLRKEGIGSSPKRKCEGGEFIEVGRIGIQDSAMTSDGIYPMEVKLDFGGGFTLTVRRG